MRKSWMAGAATGLLLAVTPATAFAAPAQDFVTGGGISSLPFDTRFGFTAHSGPQGPTGHATFTNIGGFQRKGDVTCLRVEGSEAVIGIADTDAEGNTVFRQFYIQDNGEPVNGEPVDRLTEIGQGTNCVIPEVEGLLLQQGNISIRDNTP